MTTLEAIEYRTKMNRAMTIMATALVTCAIAVGSLLMGELQWDFMALIFTVGGIALISLTYAITYDGYCRLFWTRITTLDDPPLLEWREYLEEQGAFGGDLHDY